MKTISDVMSTALITLRPEHRLYHALDCLNRYKLRILPVVDDKQRLQGLISQREIAPYISPRFGTTQESPVDRIALTREVSKVMRHDLAFVHPDDDIQHGISLMKAHMLGVVMVVERETYKLVGMMTQSDLQHGLYAVSQAKRRSSYPTIQQSHTRIA